MLGLLVVSGQLPPVIPVGRPARRLTLADLARPISAFATSCERRCSMAARDSARATAYSTHRLRAPRLRPSGRTVMNPRMRRPVKSIGRACGRASASDSRSGSRRTISSSPFTPQHMLPANQEGQPAEHLLFADVGAFGEKGAHAGSESFVVCHGYSRSVRGRPKRLKTLVSGKPVIAEMRLPLRVRTMSPYACAIGVGISQIAAEGGLAVGAGRDEPEALERAASGDGGEELSDRAPGTRVAWAASSARHRR